MANAGNNYSRFCESDYENALISLLEEAGWQYLSGSSLPRETERDVLYLDDLEQFLRRTNPELPPEDVRQIAGRLRFAGAESDFAALHQIYGWLSGGYPYTPQNGPAKMIALISYRRPEENIFRVVNQLTVAYTNGSQTRTRRPDILLYVNGIPLCIIELKNPTDRHAALFDAWKQITVRYWRDIPHLLRYCPLACISDGVKTRLGTVRAPYEHFCAWRRTEDTGTLPAQASGELQTMVEGVFRPARFLEIFRDYIYFRDTRYDGDQVAIVARYPQFFAARLLRESIIASLRRGDGKGGTYFGATGCGKTYTMAFLARQLSMRCGDIPELGSPTIVVIVDRDDLQEQGAALFTKSEEFLNLGEVRVVPSRRALREELTARESGGLYLCTIQKFCDRKDDKIGLINGRANIICFSDEAHRTQLSRAVRMQLSKDADDRMLARARKSYTRVLREAFPHATFVGFTGTPIPETYQTFGEEADRYTMDQSVADGITVPIKYHPRITKVLLDEKKAKEIEDYYRHCADEGSTAEEIEASKRAMSSLELILREPARLARLAADIHDHFTAACESDPDRVQKAMVVCSSRPTAFALLQEFRKKYPEWFLPRRAPKNRRVPPEVLRTLRELPCMAMVASVSSDDGKEMYDYLGGLKNGKRSEVLSAAFKTELSNLRIVIVVDMWITGFDAPPLTYLYNDKPLQNHQLIQTISRVNRTYPGKEYGMIVDYIGIRGHMRAALKEYGGDHRIAPAPDDAKQAAAVFREQLEVLKDLFRGRELGPLSSPDTDPALRYSLLTEAAEYVFSAAEVLNRESRDGRLIEQVSFQTYFLKTVHLMRLAYDICQPAGELEAEEAAMAQSFMSIAGFVRKMSGTSRTSDVDTYTMNCRVAKMVEEALQYSRVEDILDGGEPEDILGPDYRESLSNVKLPASRLELLVKMLRRKIWEYRKVNRSAARRYEDMLKETIEAYHQRRRSLPAEEPATAREQASEEIIRCAMEQVLQILQEMDADRRSFDRMGLTFEEKAFYDIFVALCGKYGFAYGETEWVDGVPVNGACRALAKEVKKIIDAKSSFADWLNNQNVRDQLKFDVKVYLVKSGYPPRYTPEVFREVMEQVENFKENA